MDIMKSIRDAMKYKKVTMAELAERLDKPFFTVRNTLYKGNMKIETLEQYADALGCDVVLIDRKTRKQFRP